MQNETTYSGILGEWQRLLDAMSANTTDLPRRRPRPQLPPSRSEFPFLLPVWIGACLARPFFWLG